MTCPAHPSEDLFRERLCVCRLLLAFAGSQVEPFIAAALLDFLVSVVGELACWKLGGAHLLLQVRTRCSTENGKRFSMVGIPASGSDNRRGLVRDTPEAIVPPHRHQPTCSADFQPLPQQNFSDRKNRCDSQASSSFGHSGRSLKVNPET